MKNNETYSCANGKNNCPINPRTRNHCRLCRFQKCRSVGMSKEGEEALCISPHMKKLVKIYPIIKDVKLIDQFNY